MKTAAASNASTACRVRGIVVILTFCWCLVAESVVRVLGSCQNYFGEVDIPALVCNLGANRIRQAARTLGFVSGCFGSCRSEKEVTSAVGGAGRRSEGRAELRRHNSIQTSDGGVSRFCHTEQPKSTQGRDKSFSKNVRMPWRPPCPP